jgi:hypothetical protein
MAAGIEADFEELAPVGADVIAPVRTLVEKLALLHDAGRIADHGNGKSLGQAGRHFYAALSIPGQTMEILAADVDAKSDEFGWSYTPRPGDGSRPAPVFDPVSDIRDMAEQAYSQALGLVWGERPTFDQILADLAEARDLL